MPFAICFLSCIRTGGTVAPGSVCVLVVVSGRPRSVGSGGLEWCSASSWNDLDFSFSVSTTVGRDAGTCSTEVDKFLISLGQVSSGPEACAGPFRDSQRVPLACQVPRPRRTAAHAKRRAEPLRPRRPGQVDLGCRGGQAPPSPG